MGRLINVVGLVVLGLALFGRPEIAIVVFVGLLALVWLSNRQEKPISTKKEALTLSKPIALDDADMPEELKRIIKAQFEGELKGIVIGNMREDGHYYDDDGNIILG